MGRYEDSFERYTSQISSYSRINLQREAELSALIIKSKNGKKVEQAVNELVLSNLRLVLHCLKDYNSFLSSPDICISMMDLVAEGNIALMTAARNFNCAFSRDDQPSEQARFGTYACRCIRSRMQRAIKRARLVHIPERHFTYSRKIRELEAAEGGNMTEGEISAKIGIRKERLEMVRLSNNCRTTRFGDMYSEDDNRDAMDDLPDNNQARPDEEAGRNELIDLVLQKMTLLKPRTRLMLEQMFLGSRKVTLQDLSEQFSVSKERCRQITQAGISQLRKMISSEMSTGQRKIDRKPALKWPPELSVRMNGIMENWSAKTQSLSEVA